MTDPAQSVPRRPGLSGAAPTTVLYVRIAREVYEAVHELATATALPQAQIAEILLARATGTPVRADRLVVARMVESARRRLARARGDQK